MKRRDFFKGVATLAGLTVVASTTSATLFSSIASAEGTPRKKPGSDGPEMVDPKDPVAGSLGYVADAKKSPKSAGNKCATCTLFNKTGTKDKKDIGTCAIFPNKCVYADGFCNSWAKKA